MAMTTWRGLASGAMVLLLLAGCSSGGSSHSSSPASKQSTTTAAPTDATMDRLQFRPVISVVASPSCANAAGSASTTAVGCDPSSTPSADEVSGLPDPPEGGAFLRSKDGTLIYTVGPVTFGNSSLASAEAALQETWAVNVRVRDRAVDQANAAFDDCYEATPACPAQTPDGRGAIAIVFDGVVLSAPAVNGPDLADDAFTIAGDFTEAQAKDLAKAIQP